MTQRSGTALLSRKTCPCCGRWIAPGYYDRDTNPAAPVQYVENLNAPAARQRSGADTEGGISRA